MNVQSIWVGEEYAFYDYRPNKTFVMNAKRCRALKVEKQKDMFSQRATAYVFVDVLSTETGELIQENYRVRARDIIDFWDSYKNERDAIRKEREEQERIASEQRMRLLQEREERDRIAREQREARERADAEKTTKLVDALMERTGLPREAIGTVGIGYISLDRTSVELWLSVPVQEKVVH